MVENGNKTATKLKAASWWWLDNDCVHNLMLSWFLSSALAMACRKTVPADGFCLIMRFRFYFFSTRHVLFLFFLTVFHSLFSFRRHNDAQQHEQVPEVAPVEEEQMVPIIFFNSTPMIVLVCKLGPRQSWWHPWALLESWCCCTFGASSACKINSRLEAIECVIILVV
jgi:hypothetical protein